MARRDAVNATDGHRNRYRVQAIFRCEKPSVSSDLGEMLDLLVDANPEPR